MRIFATVIAITVLLGGCVSAPETSTMTDDDFAATIGAMSASLGRSPFLMHRSPESEQAVVVIRKVENLTSDIIPVPEQWMTMARIQGSMPMRALRDTKNIVFVLPPERVRLAQEAGQRFSDTGSGLKPTHTLGAVFRSSTRAHRNSDGFVDSRVDLYMLSFELAEIESREVVWTDSFDFKRVAVGELHN